MRKRHMQAAQPATTGCWHDDLSCHAGMLRQPGPCPVMVQTKAWGESVRRAFAAASVGGIHMLCVERFLPDPLVCCATASRWYLPAQTRHVRHSRQSCQTQVSIWLSHAALYSGLSVHTSSRTSRLSTRCWEICAECSLPAAHLLQSCCFTCRSSASRSAAARSSAAPASSHAVCTISNGRFPPLSSASRSQSAAPCCRRELVRVRVDESRNQDRGYLAKPPDRGHEKAGLAAQSCRCHPLQRHGKA